MKIIKTKDGEENAYTINEVAKILKIKRITILQWLRIRLIPETYRTRVGHRVFTERQTNILKEAYEKFRVKRGSKMDRVGFSNAVYEKFNS